MTATASTHPLRKPIPLLAIILAAIAVHGPLLLMELPLGSYDAHFHIFFASHYAHHWFNPWNPKWFGGFSQTTYPGLPQQWLAIFSFLTGFNLAYMLVQMIAICLLPVGVYRFSKLWVSDRAASYAALASVFLGSLSFLVYEAGQLGTTFALPLYLNALPYLYEWTKSAKTKSLIKGLLLACAAAAAHHVTLIFGAVLFATPVCVKALLDRNDEAVDGRWSTVDGKSADGEGRRPSAIGHRSATAVVSRALVFAAIAAIACFVVLLPYFVAFLHNPIKQVPIPHASRSNFLLNPEWGLNYFVVPYGFMLFALPYIFYKGWVEARLRPLFLGFWLTMLCGLGGTTPVPRWLFGRAYWILTYERFTFWATVLAQPFVGLAAVWLLDRYGKRAIIALSAAAVITCAFAVSWTTFHPINYDKGLDVKPVAQFLNRDGHDKYRYLTLGFGDHLSQLSTMTDADTVDGEYNSARMLPELTAYGAAQLTNSKYYGTAGMEALRAILEHANKYGLKWVFVRDSYYEPLLAFAGWRQVDALDHGAVSVWSKDDVPPAQPVQANYVPSQWEGLMWGIFPVGSSLLALFAVILLPERKRVADTIPFPAHAPETAVGGVK